MMQWKFPYRSQRMPVMAENVVASSQPLAVQAGLRMLLKGGNAVDAAIATAITLTVVEPTSNGIGSDAFAIIWDGEKLHGINGSGRSPENWSYKRFSHLDHMPLLGWDSVTVPGAVSVWVELSKKFGRLKFEELFEPAISYARNGFAVSPITADRWRSASEIYKDFPEFHKLFLPEGKSPKAGEPFMSKDQANTLEEIAETAGESFYRGALAEKIATYASEQGGALTFQDLANHQPFWVQPLSQSYRDVHLHEIPPNGQGIAAAITLGILGNFNLMNYPTDSADSIHLQVEAMKLAFADTKRHLSDIDSMKMDYHELLAPEYLATRAKQIDIRKAQFPDTGIPADKGTVYLTTADSKGMMVSFIQSNYKGFGSGVVVPDTGISLHNRALGFTLEKGHPNQVDGGKRPFHTIIPAFVTRAGKPVMSFGVMGAHMQAQGHVQMMVRVIDYDQNPQTASDAPRWHVMPDSQLAVEAGFSPDVLKELTNRGHKLLFDEPESLFGGAQLIYKQGNFYISGSDHRKDGLAIGF
jgi:gamma-glutamyltranspeptidase / glutathione hydrolase